MSLRFVTRKLKTQTLGDDEGEVETANNSVTEAEDKSDATTNSKDEKIEREETKANGKDTLKEKKISTPTTNARSRRVLRHRHHERDESESEEEDDREREPSRIQRGKVKNPTGSTIKGHENTQKNADLAKPLPTNIEQIEFASPSSTISLPNYQPKVSSVFDATHGLPPPTSNAYATSTGPIVKPKSNHSFGAISHDAMMMLEDNYSSEEELKEIISSEKQRKRSGGGSVKDGKAQHRVTARGDHHMQHRNEDSNARKLSVKRGSLGADNIATCQPLSPSLSSSPSSGKMILSCSRPSSGRSSKLARVTPSLASTNAAEKRKWSEVEYSEYCCNCKHDECPDSDRGRIISDIQTCGINGKKTFVSSVCNASSIGSTVRCRASGTISAPPVPAVLMVRRSRSTTGARCGGRCESVSRSGSSGCSSQHSCCGDDEDAYIGGDGGCCNLRSTPRLHNISRGSSAGGNGNRHSDVPTPVQFCTSPPLDVHRPTRSHGSRSNSGNDSTHIQSDAITMSRKTEREYGRDGSLFVTANETLSREPSSSSPPPSKLFHYDDTNKNDRMSGNPSRYNPVPVCSKGKAFQSAHYTGKDNGENSEKDADEEVENMMENSRPLQNFEFVSMDLENVRKDCSGRDKYSEAMDEITGRCNKDIRSKIARGKEGQRCSRGLSLRSCKMKSESKIPSTLRRRSHSQSRIPSVHQHYQENSGLYHVHHMQRGVGHLHRRRNTPSPSKRHRLTPRPPPHNSNTQRPSLDFEKMQNIKKRVITSWRPQGTELSLFCW